MTVMDAKNDACGVMLEPAKRHGPRRVRLAQFTTVGVGGAAELWVCHDMNELLEATRAPYRVLGGGSNLIVSDDGVNDRVIKLGGDFSRADLERDPQHDKQDDRAGSSQTHITGWIGAAKPIPALIRALQKRGLSGLEGLVGIPAVVGGAVRMNAGTRYGEMADALHAIEVVTDGEARIYDPSELGFKYRNSRLPHGQHGVGIVTRVKLKLTPSTPEAVQERMNLADEARKGQPHWRTFGCAWKNPAEDSAGRLVDRAGLKGTRVGGAMVSHEHGNFIINTGGATATDVLELMRIIEAKLGVPLEREVEIWDANLEPTHSSQAPFTHGGGT